MYDEATIREFMKRLRNALPETPMPTDDFSKGYNNAMMLVSEKSDEILEDMITEKGE